MPERLPYQPDLIINPSLLDQQYYPSGVFIPVPVCTDPACPCTHKVTWRKRERAELFVHNAGRGGLRGRNGRAEVLEAWRHVRSGAKLVVRCQGKHPHHEFSLISAGGIAAFFERSVGYDRLWDSGEVFLFPDHFNGLSLPLQEARASGMLVMSTDRFPANTWLPREPLIPVGSYRKARVGPPYNEIDEAVVEPRAIAAKVDEWFGRDISAYSEAGRVWAEENSWARLGPKYREALCA